MGIYDFVLCADKTIAAVDNNSQILFYYKKALIKTVEEKCQFLISANQIGKVLCADGRHLYFINNANDGVVRVDTKNFERLRIPFEDSRLFQLSVVDGRMYAISENGAIHLCYNKLEAPGADGEEEDGELHLQYTLKSVKLKVLSEYEAGANSSLNSSLVEDGGDPENAEDRDDDSDQDSRDTVENLKSALSRDTASSF